MPADGFVPLPLARGPSLVAGRFAKTAPLMVCVCVCVGTDARLTIIYTRRRHLHQPCRFVWTFATFAARTRAIYRCVRDAGASRTATPHASLARGGRITGTSAGSASVPRAAGSASAECTGTRHAHSSVPPSWWPQRQGPSTLRTLSSMISSTRRTRVS